MRKGVKRHTKIAKRELMTLKISFFRKRVISIRQRYITALAFARVQMDLLNGR